MHSGHVSSKWSTVPVSEKPKITSAAIHPVQCTFTIKLVRNCQLEVQVKVSGMGRLGGRKAGNQASASASATPCCAATPSKLNAKQNLVGSLVAFLARRG